MNENGNYSLAPVLGAKDWVETFTTIPIYTGRRGAMNYASAFSATIFVNLIIGKQHHDHATNSMGAPMLSTAISLTTP